MNDDKTHLPSETSQGATTEATSADIVKCPTQDTIFLNHGCLISLHEIESEYSRGHRWGG